jgi:hypothetical protein
MATSLLIEEERGTCTGFLHPHNGYYAGSFTTLPEAAQSQPGGTLAPVQQLTFRAARPVRAAA